MSSRKDIRRRQLQNLDDEIISAIRAVEHAVSESLKAHGSHAAITVMLGCGNDLMRRARSLHRDEIGKLL